MKPYLFSILISILLLPAAYAQEVSFEAYADAKEVVLNSYFELSFTLKNGDGVNFKPPSFGDFRVVAGPGRSVSTTIVQGVVSKELSYSYTLQPKRLGKFTIGSATIRVNGKELRTRPITIGVIEGKTASAGGEEEVFVRAEPSVADAWVGQQIVLDYKLYTSINIDNYNVLEESEYPGFFAEDVRRFDSRIVREVIDGVQYATKILRRVALYPQQSGKLTVDPMQIQLGVVAEGGDRRNSFFFNRQIRRVPVTTEPITINVRSLPEGAPPSFTGAVGKYQMECNLSRSEFTTDDVVQLTVNISGDGDIKRVQPPDIGFPKSFDVYDPKILEESKYENGNRVVGKKVIEYLALPGQAGQFTLKPAFSFFDPDSARYITLQAQTFAVSIEAGSARPRRPLVDPELAESSTQDIKYIKLETAVRPKRQYFLGSPLFWVLLAFPFASLGAVIGFRQYAVKKAGMDPLLVRTKRARKVALKRLKTAENFLNAKDSRNFYDEISKAMLGYVCDKLQIPLSELTKDNVRSKLESLLVAPELIEDFMGIIKTTEMALFAGMDNADAMQDTYHKTLEVLTNIEQATN